MTIKENIEFNPEVRLQDQSQEFQNWLMENCLSKIAGLTPDMWDEFERPKSYTFQVEDFNVVLIPKYLYSTRSSWAIGGYKININGTESI